MDILAFGVRYLGGSLITGAIGFGIAMFQCNRSAPLEKMEISYNRIYYPMSLLLRSKSYKEINQEEVRGKMDLLLKKYDKYISQRTRYTYSKYLKAFEKGKKRKIKNTFQDFMNDILYNNSKLRWKLGYPQASIWEMLNVLEWKSKLVLIIFVLILFISVIVFVLQTIRFFGILY